MWCKKMEEKTQTQNVTQTQDQTQVLEIKHKLNRIWDCTKNIELVLLRLAQELGDNHYAVQYIAESIGLIRIEVKEIKKLLGE